MLAGAGEPGVGAGVLAFTEFWYCRSVLTRNPARISSPKTLKPMLQNPSRVSFLYKILPSYSRDMPGQRSKKGP